MNTPKHNIHQSINILAFDTSGDEASLALRTGGNMRSVSLPRGAGPHSQAACLLPVMQELLKEACLNFQDLHVIATPTGPGSFTGIRLGLATAQGLVLSTGARSFAPTTFQLLAFGAWKEKIDSGMSPEMSPGTSPALSCLVTLTTKRDSFYTQGFDQTFSPSGMACIQTKDEIQNFLSLHPGICRVSHLSTPGAENLIHFYFYQLSQSQAFLPELSGILRPYYVHEPDFIKQNLCSL